MGDTMIGHVFKIVKCDNYSYLQTILMQGLVKKKKKIEIQCINIFCLDTKCKWIKQLISWIEFGF